MVLTTHKLKLIKLSVLFKFMKAVIGDEYSQDVDIYTDKNGNMESKNDFVKDIRLDKILYTDTPDGIKHRIFAELSTDTLEDVSDNHGIPYIEGKMSQTENIDINSGIVLGLMERIKNVLENNIDTIVRGSVFIVPHKKEQQIIFEINYSYFDNNMLVKQANITFNSRYVG